MKHKKHNSLNTENTMNENVGPRQWCQIWSRSYPIK